VSRSLRRTGDLVVGLLALAILTAPGARAALPAGYVSGIAENPAPTTAADHFGANIVNAGDVNSDGKDDLLVGVPDWRESGALPGVSGKVVFVDGQTGDMITTVKPPQGDTLISHEGASTAFGAQVATIGDLNGDGVPEHVVSAPGSDLSASAVDMGIVYVLDGKAHSVLKKIELAADDQPGSSPGFGNALTSAGGEPACSGFGGTAPCPDAPNSLVARGDLDARGESDIVIGAPDYEENAANETNLAACPIGGPANCPGLGRVYVYGGEDIVGSPSAPLTGPIFTIQYPDQATAGQQPRLGAALSPIGDVGTCAFDESQVQPSTSNCLAATQQVAPSNVPDGYPDFLASAPGLSAGSVTGAGQTYVVDGRHGHLIAALGSPDPQQDSGFGPPANHQTAPGNLGASALPDVYLAATAQNLSVSGQGRGYAFSGDVLAPNLLARLDDPEASSGGGFGVFAGLGDVVGDDQLSEFALGRVAGGPVRILSSCQMTALETIPDAEGGAHFGAAIAPMGDLNGDGYLDLAIGAPEHNGGVGRVYLMKSNGAPGPGISCKPPDPGGGGGGGGGAPGGGSGGGSGAGNTPTGGGKKVGSLAKRSISFSADKKRVKVSKRLVLGGRIKSRKRRAACERKQKVAIQRFARNNSWQTIDVAVSRKNGRFSVEAFPGPARTFIYRARVNQTRRCVGATSKRVKVKVLP
jgi:FG-GAP repeat